MKASELLLTAEQERLTGRLVIELKDGGMSDFKLPANKKNSGQVRKILDKVVNGSHKEKEGA
jgi:hypothetical protein